MEHDQVMRALDYAHEQNVRGLRSQQIKDNIELSRKDGDDVKAHMLTNRLASLKQHDELNMKKKDYRPILAS